MDAGMEPMLADIAERDAARCYLWGAQVWENEEGRPEYNPDDATRRLEFIGATIARIAEARDAGDLDTVLSLVRHFTLADVEALHRLANAPEARRAFAGDKVKVGEKYVKPKQSGVAKNRNVRNAEQDAERYRAQIRHIMRTVPCDEKEADKRWLDEEMKREYPHLHNRNSPQSKAARKALRGRRDRWKQKA